VTQPTKSLTYNEATNHIHREAGEGLTKTLHHKAYNRQLFCIGALTEFAQTLLSK